MKFALTGPFLFVLYGLTSAVEIIHIYVPRQLTWADAQTFCKYYYTDMSYITSEEDLQMLQEAGGTFSQGWIGLYRETNSSNWLWSSGHAYGFSKLHEDKEVAPACVYATPNVWQSDLCGIPKHFFCYDNFTLSLETANKTWEKALEYCWSYKTELAGATSQYQFDLLRATDQNSTTSAVWMGLRFLTGKWIWISRGFKHLKFNGTLASCPAEPYRCGAYNKITGHFENRDCDEKLNFVCY